MNSPLLQGGGRRRRRLWRRGEGLARARPRPRPRVTRWLVGALVLILAAGAATWALALRHKHAHLPPSAALLRGGTLGGARTHKTPGSIAIPARNVLSVHFGDPPRAGLLLDMRRGRVLWSVRPLMRVPVASLTKIMTAILVVEHTRPHERAPVTKEALAYQGQALGLLPPHHSVPIEGLLAGLLLTSANDAAITLADRVSGSDARFAGLMNRKARTLGLRCSHFVSAYGLQDGNVSCAADLAALARIAMHKRRITYYSHQEQARVPFPIKGGYLYVTSTNPLLRSGYPGTLGLKTGFTTKAGRCLVAVVRRRGRTLIAVLLNSPDPAGQAKKLFEAAFRRR